MHSLIGRGVTSQQIEQLAQASVGQKAAAGHPLMNEGDRPSGLVFLLQGGVEVFKHGPDGQRQSLAKLEAPTLLGEMSLITDRPSSATVMAVTECELQLLTKAQFQRLIAADTPACSPSDSPSSTARCWSSRGTGTSSRALTPPARPRRRLSPVAPRPGIDSLP